MAPLESCPSLMVPQYQVSDDVSTTVAIPLQDFLSVDDIGWWYVGPHVLEDVPFSFIGGRRVRRSWVCTPISLAGTQRENNSGVA